MKAHRSLQRADIRSRPPQKIALMIASEFSRAAHLADDLSAVFNCYDRAKELMGILETIPLPDPVAYRLQPLFSMCCERELLTPDHLTPESLQNRNTLLTEAFIALAQTMTETDEASHA